MKIICLFALTILVSGCATSVSPTGTKTTTIDPAYTPVVSATIADVADAVLSKLKETKTVK